METLKQIYATPETFKEIDWVTEQVNMELLKFEIGLSAMQKNLFIKENGEFDLHLATEYLKSLQNKSRKELGSQNSSARIMAVQITLESMGYSIGKIDGILGPNTKEGIQRFQEQTGITVDGLPGQETIKKIIETIGQKNSNTTKTENVRREGIIEPLQPLQPKIVIIPKPYQEEPHVITEDEIANNIFSGPEGENTSEYIKYLMNKPGFNDIQKHNIKRFGPTIIKETQKYPETKNIIPKIFAQVRKESRRITNKINTNGEHSIGLFQINKASGHDGHINNHYYNIDTTRGNIQYGVAYLAQCIQQEGGNIANGLDRYNGGGNFGKPRHKRYSYEIMHDQTFS